MHFGTKSYLKSTCNHTAKHALSTNKNRGNFVEIFKKQNLIILEYYSILDISKEMFEISLHYNLRMLQGT